MRVLHVTPSYYPNIGGIEAVIRNMCGGLQKRGIEVAVAHLEPGLRTSTDIDEAFGFPIHRMPVTGHRLLGLALMLGKISQNYDVLHVHDPQLMAITASVRLCAGDKPRVLSTHGFYGHTQNLSAFKSLHETFLLHRLLKSYSTVLAASKSDFTHAKKFTSNAVLFENGIDASAFKAEPSGHPRNLKHWIYWGRLSQNKRPDLLVDLVHTLKERGIHVTLTITGRRFDDMQGKLEYRIEELGLSDQVTLLPALGDAELKTLLASAGLFVSASEYEGFGLTFVEAMAAGLGIVCRDKPPMSEFANASGAGVAVDFDDMKVTADRVAHLMESNPLAINTAATDFADQYDWAAKMDALVAHYSAALSDGKMPSSTKTL